MGTARDKPSRRAMRAVHRGGTRKPATPPTTWGADHGTETLIPAGYPSWTGHRAQALWTRQSAARGPYAAHGCARDGKAWRRIVRPPRRTRSQWPPLPVPRAADQRGLRRRALRKCRSTARKGEAAVPRPIPEHRYHAGTMARMPLSRRRHKHARAVRPTPSNKNRSARNIRSRPSTPSRGKNRHHVPVAFQYEGQRHLSRCKPRAIGTERRGKTPGRKPASTSAFRHIPARQHCHIGTADDRAGRVEIEFGKHAAHAMISFGRRKRCRLRGQIPSPNQTELDRTGSRTGR